MNKQKYLSRASVILCLMLLMLAGGCKKKAPVAPPPPPPPPPPASAPTATLSASPSTIERGQSSTLSWTTTGATSVSIDQGIGDVSTSGSRSVSPSSSTTYTLTAKGEGGTTPATARITVTAPPHHLPRHQPVQARRSKRSLLRTFVTSISTMTSPMCATTRSRRWRTQLVF